MHQVTPITNSLTFHFSLFKVFYELTSSRCTRCNENKGSKINMKKRWHFKFMVSPILAMYLLTRYKLYINYVNSHIHTIRFKDYSF
jgi:hypothetical protein